ncbi:MAG TPA: hypothetical protein VFG73_03495 [Rhodanobacteraceae bacterium]|nr:hypothetical protein [Rhodanobacteraceae bacterium]
MRFSRRFTLLFALAALLAANLAWAGVPVNVAINGTAGVVALSSPAVGVAGTTQTVTLTFASNGSTMNALLTGLSVGGANATDFTIVGGTCEPNTTILNGSNPTCTAIIQYRASAASPETATLVGSCTTVGTIGGYTVSCTGAPGQLSAFAGTVLAAVASMPVPLLDPKVLTALCGLLLGIGVYFASRNRKRG